jgi:hypothetical protein
MQYKIKGVVYDSITASFTHVCTHAVAADDKEVSYLFGITFSYSGCEASYGRMIVNIERHRM